MKSQNPLGPLKPRALPALIKTKRLVIKRVKPSMAQTLFNTVAANREHLNTFLPWPPLMKTVEDQRKWAEGTVARWQARDGFIFAIYLHDGTHIGAIDLHTISWPHHRAEFGYWIAKAHQGFGYITESVQALEKVAFDLGFHRLEIRCDKKNKRSSAIPQRLGYKLEGILRHQSVMSGEYRDMMVFGKLNPAK